MTNLPMRFSLIPDPQHNGDRVQVCYDFSGLPGTAVQVTVTFDPPTGSMSSMVTPGDPCFEVDIPSTAKGMDIYDTPRKSAVYRTTILS